MSKEAHTLNEDKTVMYRVYYMEETLSIDTLIHTKAKGRMNDKNRFIHLIADGISNAILCTVRSLKRVK